ncbi:MAG: glycosyltransferase family 1 protein [Gemmataceae bacterium]|nr:glycosyltransferase family 1 protein [Gemmataceae bacterium]
MRILVNYLPALKQRSGIGHYTAEVCRNLELMGLELDLFPPADWQKTFNRLAFLWNSNRQKSASDGSSTLVRKVFSWGKSLARQSLRQAYSFAFSRRASDKGHDLYFEPNFLPLETGLPTVATIHDLGVFKNPSWHPADRVREFEKRFTRAVKTCKHFLTGSESVKKEMVEVLGIPSEKITVTYNGIRQGLKPLPMPVTRALLREMKLPPRYFLHIGTVEPRKNLLFLMKAYCQLPAKIRDQYPLLLVGGWGWNAQEESRFFEKTARHQGVVLSGYIPDDKIPAVYNGARALLFPTHYEGFGFPTVEMMACGGPVIASRIGVNIEIAGGKACLVDLDDQAGWTEAMNRMALDDDWRAQLVKGVRENAARFTWVACAKKTFSAFQIALGQNQDKSLGYSHQRLAG